VFVSSAAARLGVAGHTVYGPTKAANEALARVWAKELGHSHGVTVNCVNPGPVATGKKTTRRTIYSSAFFSSIVFSWFLVAN
jgi:NAD(P)-dependent dehydrogenase (short-subunit alcohol dehydrogenase family)